MPIRHGLRHQHGALLLGAVLILFAAVAVLFITFLINTLQSRLEKTAGSATRLHLSEKALIEFVAREGRLPCPADGSLLLGDANRGIEQSCTFLVPDVSYQSIGILPWRTLGLDEAAVINAYGDYFSYRVFSGPTGFTRTNGADMSHCDTDNTPIPTDPFAAATDCESVNHNNTSDQFILNKGLTVVRPDNSSATDVAFVVIDHGPNRRGARNPSGSVVASTLVGRPEEVANTAGIAAADYRGTFYSRAPAIGSDESAAGYFDDVLHYRSIVEVARLAGRYARNWPDTYFGGNPNTPSTDPTAPKFVGTSNPELAGRDFVPGGSGVDASLSFGAGSGNYAACLWYPVPIPLFDGTNSRTFRMALEFGMDEDTDDFAAGFTAGFLSATAASGPPTNDLCGNTLLSRIGTGFAGTNTLALDSTVGVFVGQRITGDGIPDTTLITAVSQTPLTLSLNNTGPVSGTVTFSPTPVTKTGSGTAGSNYITVSNLTGIRTNSLVTGTGVAAGARVMTAAGATLRLTRPNTGSVSGNVTFSGPTVSITATGSSGFNIINIASPYGIENGMVVTGTGIAPGAVVSSIQGGTVTLDRNLTNNGPYGTGTRTVRARPIDLADIRRDLGWAGGVLGSGYPDRFAVEIDPGYHPSAFDPSTTHLAADYQGITHNDAAAASCAAAASGAACDQHPSSGSFLVNDISTFHNLRIELIPDQHCLSTTGTGNLGADTVTVLSTAGLLVGMNVVGPGIGANAKIKTIDVPTLTLTLTTPHVEAFASKPLTLFGDSLTQTSSGALGSTSLTVADSTVLAVGMRLSGTGIAPGAGIVSIDSGTSVTVSAPHSPTAVSGAVTFKGRGPNVRVVAKAWVLSNAGCTADASTCLAMKNVDNDFSVSLATNAEALQIAQCMPVPTIQSAYESLYFGLTTANRDIYGVGVTNFVVRRLFTN